MAQLIRCLIIGVLFAACLPSQADTTQTDKLDEKTEKKAPQLLYWYRNYDSPATLELLKLAINKTVDLYGPLKIVRSKELSQGRALAAVADHQEHLVGIMNVVVDEYRQEADALIPIPIATDQGLVGYRICLINEGETARFADVRSHADIFERDLVFGQGVHWPDTRILEANQLPVVTSARYEHLFGMLKGKRFNCFLRGANEIINDLEKSGESNIVIEPSLAFVYPSVSLFFVSRHDPDLAARIELGLRRAILSGDFSDFLQRHYRDSLRLLDVRNRRVIRLNNPLIDNLKMYQRSGYLLSPEGKINY